MYSVFDPRRYEIRKNHALVDLNTYIQSVINNDHPHGSYMEMMSNPHPLIHDEITGVEADAAKYAYDNNLVPQLNSIYHEGPSNPSYMQAFRGLVNAGAPFINEAIKRSNNMGVHEQIPMAFDAEGRLTSQWRGGVAVHRAQNKEYPIYENGRLVTTLRSHFNGLEEEYTRPYHRGLDQMRKERGINVRTRDSISPSLVHRNAINIQNASLHTKYHNTIRRAIAENPNQDPMLTALEALRTEPSFAVHAGLQHGPFEPGRHVDNDPTNDGTPAEEEQEVSEQSGVQPFDDTNLDNFHHPDDKNDAWYKHLHSNTDYKTGNIGRQIRGFMERHGFGSEDEARQFFMDVYQGKRGQGRNYRQRFKTALKDHHMADGTPPPWYGGGTPPPSEPLTAQAPQQEQPPAEDINTEQPPVEAPPVPPPPMNPPPARPPPRSSVVAAPPLPVRPRNSAPPPPMAVPAQPQQMPQAPLNQQPYAANQPPNQQQGRFGSLVDRFLDRLGYGFEGLFPSLKKSEMNEIEQIQEVLEFVQVEIAKQEISAPIQKKSINSHNDVSHLAQEMRCPPSDIVAIFESRGDWENIAKKWNRDVQDVQKVKVMFNG